MKTYTEAECIKAIERNWGEIDSYAWNGDHEDPAYRCVNVTFTAAAAEAIAARCNASPGAKRMGRKLTARDVAKQSFRESGLARELGHAAYDCPSGDCPEVAAFVDGGIAIFDDHAEYVTWCNQR